MKNRKNYAIREGLVLEREFYGRQRTLRVILDGEIFKFRVDDRLFSSLTAAARYVVGDETRQINGPEFWGAPLVQQ